MILLVEDEDVLLWIVNRVLSDKGYTVRTAATMKQAYEVVAQHGEDIDLAIVDLQMSDGSGWDFAARIWQTRPETNVVITSGFRVTEPPPGLSVPEGRLHFLPKPYEMDELMNMVRSLVAG